MEVGEKQRWGEEMKEAEQSGEKVCFGTHQRLTQNAKRQPNGGSFEVHFGLCVSLWPS